ncbi:MAG TPA: hypothetical protein VIL58_02785 [Thermoplasmata archaeon]
MGTREAEAWLLTERGILAPDGKPVTAVPFGERSAVAGVSREDIGVIVDEHEVWILSGGRWTKAASSGDALYSIERAEDGRFLVGTERARVAWVEGGRLAYIEAFDAVLERGRWDTPYGAPPELRSLAVSTDGTIYADVHVGWIVRSRDGGKSWTSVRRGLDRDVHMVATHPTDPATVFAATADGFHISHDHGDSFQRRREGMPYHYQRAVACFPERDVYLASTARHNGGSGALLFRSEDEGEHWTHVNGLPRVDQNINTWQVATFADGHALAVVRDTDLYASEDWGVSWAKVREGLPTVNAILPL